MYNGKSNRVIEIEALPMRQNPISVMRSPGRPKYTATMAKKVFGERAPSDELLDIDRASPSALVGKVPLRLCRDSLNNCPSQYVGPPYPWPNGNTMIDLKAVSDQMDRVASDVEADISSHAELVTRIPRPNARTNASATNAAPHRAEKEDLCLPAFLGIQNGRMQEITAKLTTTKVPRLCVRSVTPKNARAANGRNRFCLAKRRPVARQIRRPAPSDDASNLVPRIRWA